MWWCICIQCFTTGNTLSIPSPHTDKKLVFMQLCVCYCSIALLCHLLHSIHIQVQIKMQRAAIGGLLSCMPVCKATEKWLLHSLTMVSCCVSLVFGMLCLH